MREPPPRKAKLTHFIKTTQLEQLAKLQNKHQQECDLLDDIRNFSKQRSQIEKDYGQALQKLVQMYQKKDWPAFEEAEDKDTDKPVLAVWKAVLDATDQAGQARITTSDNYKNSIYEAAKNTRVLKEGQLKKSQELLNTLQNEISETVKELSKAKKKYYEMEQTAAMAQDKYQEVNDKLKKNQTSIFKSKAGLEKAFQKLQQKCDESSTNATIARNEYLLMLGAANAHQTRYYEVDMPEAMRVLDGNVFVKLQEYLQQLSQFEINVCNETQETYAKSLQDAAKISRTHNVRCFLRENSVFSWGPRFEFEASGEDDTNGKLMEEQPGNDNSLNREARKWAYRVERDINQLSRLRKIKEGLDDLTSKYAVNSTLSSEGTAQETEVRLEKCKQDIRKIETARLQGEARLTLLREADVDVNTWVESAKAQIAKEAASSASTPLRPSTRRKPTTPSVETPDINGGSFVLDADESFYDDDFDETFDDETVDLERDNLSLPSSDHSRNYPVTCTVNYAYKATRADELSIAVGDQIEVVEDGDLDQWVKARDRSGKLGYVPEYYLEFPSKSLSLSTPHHYAVPPGEDYSNTLESSTSGTSSLTTSTSGNDREVSNITSGVEIGKATRGICLAKAIYEYEGCSSEELSFPEGAIINILTKDDNGIDDGWWKGELNGKTGVFPGLVVEEMGSSAHDRADSPPETLLVEEPPDFRPPPPSECPPPPPSDSTSPYNPGVARNGSLGSNYPIYTNQSELTVPDVKHERANSAPASPAIYGHVIKRPQRAAPAPPQRPSSLYRTSDYT